MEGEKTGNNQNTLFTHRKLSSIQKDEKTGLMLVQFHSSNNKCASTHMPRGQLWALRTLPSTSFCTYRLFRNKACAYCCLMYYLLLKLFIIKQTSKKSFIKKRTFTKCILRLGTCEVMERDSNHKPLQQEKDQEAIGVRTK